MNAVTSWWNNLTTFEKEKLEADPFYMSMVKAGYDYETLQRSGWLNHAYSYEQMQKINKRTATQFGKQDIFILLNTGSYAPAHQGHIEQLKVARSWVKEHYPDYHTVMCLSPSHDKYVLTKSEDILPWNINNRVDKLYEIMSQDSSVSHEELVLDLWEAVACEYPVNFTDVIIKFAQDLQDLNINFKIGYVFGSDNEEFLLPFAHLPESLADQFFAFCVKRHGFELHINSQANNVIYLNTHEIYSALASRNLRKNTVIKHQAFYTKDENTSFYAVRQDASLALKKWWHAYPEYTEQLNMSYQAFHKDLCAVLEAFTQKPVKSINLDTQLILAKEIAKTTAVLNLDLATNTQAGQALDYTRIFTLASDQRRPNAMVKRPEASKEAIQKYAPGAYAFMDDDIASGKTFELISQNLAKQGISFNTQYNLTELYCEKQSWQYNLFDIVDTKDFLFGAYSGGLLCETSHGSLRLPYFMRFINLYTRASIKPSKWLMFQEEINRLNIAFFKQNHFLCDKDIEKGLKSFLNVKGKLDDWFIENA